MQPEQRELEIAHLENQIRARFPDMKKMPDLSTYLEHLIATSLENIPEHARLVRVLGEYQYMIHSQEMDGLRNIHYAAEF